MEQADKRQARARAVRIADEYAGRTGEVNLIESVLVVSSTPPIDCAFPPASSSP